VNTNLRSSVIAVLVLASALASATSIALGADLEAPQIVIANPSGAAEPAAAPAHIDIRFEPAVGTRIDISSFQVLYQFGVFRKDITARILPYVTLTASGVTGVVPANLPPGTHTLIIRIRDSQRRTSEQEVKFHVGSQ
jgi:outer membrane receptor protein involved in Fe transport